MEIKIRNKTYTAQPGDYVFYNGACHQLMTGDRRPIRWEKFGSHDNVVLTASIVARLPLASMRKVGPNEKGYTFWYF